MKRVLGKSMNRQLRLLEVINQSENCDIKSLAKKFKVSAKTITKDIKEINEIIYPLEIVESISLQYYVNVPSEYSFEFIYSCFLTSSIEYQLLEAILLDESYSYQELADKLFISVSSLRRLIARINSNLLSEGVKIESNPCRLIGDELQLTNFLCHYLIEKYAVTANFLDEFEQELLELMTDKVLEFAQIERSFAYKEMAKFIFIANVIRVRNGHEHEEVTHVQPYDEILNLLREIPLFSYKFKEVFKITFSSELLDKAGHVIFQPMHASTMADLKEKVATSPEVKKKVKAIEEVVLRLKERASLQMSNPKLIFRLYNLSVSYYGPIYTLNDLDTYFLEGIEQKWPDFYKMLKEEYQAQAPVLQAEQFSSFSFFLITEWLELTTYLSVNQKKIKMGLFFTTTETHMKFISGELERLLPDMAEITLLSSGSDRELKEKEIDVIITNINNFTNHTASICISRYVSTRDIEKITSFYNNWTRAH